VVTVKPTEDKKRIQVDPKDVSKMVRIRADLTDR
jgi:hypothetical protein